MPPPTTTAGAKLFAHRPGVHRPGRVHDDRDGHRGRAPRLDLAGSTFAVHEAHEPEAPRRIAQIDVTLRLPASLSPADRTLLERTAHTCPVALSLHPDIEQNMMFEYK